MNKALGCAALVCVLALGCDGPACSPCRPGYHAKETGGTCMPDADAGAPPDAKM